MRSRVGQLIVAITLIFISCKNDDESSETIDNATIVELIQDEIIQNPSGYAPLSAIIYIQAKEIIRADIRVLGKNGEDSDIIQSFPESGRALEIPIHGLFADFENTVELTFFNADFSIGYSYFRFIEGIIIFHF